MLSSGGRLESLPPCSRVPRQYKPEPCKCKEHKSLHFTRTEHRMSRANSVAQLVRHDLLTLQLCSLCHQDILDRVTSRSHLRISLLTHFLPKTWSSGLFQVHPALPHVQNTDLSRSAWSAYQVTRVCRPDCNHGLQYKAGTGPDTTPTSTLHTLSVRL